ncbi:hypothetical protein BF17_22030 [Yersinia similis]|uniref:Toxin SymE-like domain-containing protein n=1 Tax=Yersinia similis TaxID=367190 RepID=A0ABN4CTZ2_9GAMM|nr:SymE family type I addiction module toxin [Yersinia similis]AHK21641.1 hypothetical protein BF17_22030 [Yersinia similis]
MTEQDSISEAVISKAQRRYKVGYVSIQHAKCATKMTTYYSRTPSLHLKGNWLKEAEFGTDTPVTLAIEHGRLIIQTNSDF